MDILPTLLDLAAESTGTRIPDAIDPLDGRSLVPLCDGNVKDDPNCAISEYLAEGTGEPMLMIRKGKHKYICCASDPEQLFNLETDPDERENLVGSADRDLLAEFRAAAEAHWNADEIKKQVITDQNRRRRVHAALQFGHVKSWDYNPPRDATAEYTRSHMDLTKADISSRYPRPEAFNPQRK